MTKNMTSFAEKCWKEEYVTLYRDCMDSYIAKELQVWMQLSYFHII